MSARAPFGPGLLAIGCHSRTAMCLVRPCGERERSESGMRSAPAKNRAAKAHLGHAAKSILRKVPLARENAGRRDRI
jgi:hypothetical protein